MKSTKLAVTSTGQPKLTFCTTRPAINFIMLVCKEHVASNAMEAQTKTYRTIFYNLFHVIHLGAKPLWTKRRKSQLTSACAFSKSSLIIRPLRLFLFTSCPDKSGALNTGTKASLLHSTPVHTLVHGPES